MTGSSNGTCLPTTSHSLRDIGKAQAKLIRLVSESLATRKLQISGNLRPNLRILPAVNNSQ